MVVDQQIGEELQPISEPPTVDTPDDAARAHLLVGVAFLVFASLVGLLLALKMTWPSLLDATGFLSFGRLYPVFTGALLFGWLTLSLLGAMYYVIPRLTGAPLWGEAVARLNLIVLAGAFGVGIVAVALGQNQGRNLFEFPWWVDLPVLVGLGLAALIVTKSVAARVESNVYISLWFFLGSVYWLLLAYLVGSLVGFKGADSMMAGRFAESALVFLGLLPAALGIAFYLVPKLTGQPLYSERLGAVSFWGLAGSFAWIGAHSLTYSPAPDYLETISAVFAISILVPILAVLTNLALTMQGAWDQVRSSVPLKFVVAGAAFFSLLALQVPALTLRSSSAITQFTSWVEAGFILTTMGIASMWLFALLHHVRPARSGDVHLLFTAVGLALLVGTLWVGGLLAGFTWSGAPVSDVFNNFGDGFVNTSGQLASFDGIRWVAWAGIAAGQMLFAVRLIQGRWVAEPILMGAAQPDTQADDDTMADDTEADDTVFGQQLTPGKVAVAAVMLFALAFLTTAVAPISDTTEEASLLALSYRDYVDFETMNGATAQSVEAFERSGLSGPQVFEGWQLYISEGCWYCHTQQVRAVVTDVGLGAVTQRSDLVFDSPQLTGHQRLGPDLMHAGAREPTNSVDWNIAHLRDPRRQRPWSFMPSYDYLSDTDLDAVAQYVVSLK